MREKNTYKRGISLLLACAVLFSTIFCLQVPVNAATIRNNRVTVSVQASSTAALRIRWNSVSLAQGYVIFRRASVKLPWTRVAVVSKGTTSYLDRNLTSGKPYQYAVRAYRRESGRNIYSLYTPVTAATRPLKTTVIAKAVSSSRVNISWTRVSRCDGYYVYRRAAGENWKHIATLDRTRRSMADTRVSGGTKYVYCVRAYKKGGNVSYLAPMTQSSVVTTPAASSSSNGSSSGNYSKYSTSQLDVMKKILYAVETGGQIYGNQDYDDFTEAYTNSSAEHAITIGAGQWYATEAQRLLKLLHDRYPTKWAKEWDPNNYVWNDVVNRDWSTYRISASSGRAKIIRKIIGSAEGIKCQDELMYEQIQEYEQEIRNLGITEARAVGMLINVRHQGGYGAVTRILGKTKRPVTLDSIYAALNTDTGNQVGAYKTRQAKVYSWLKTYMS